MEEWYKIANFSKGRSVKMSEEFVNKVEFNALKEEVNKIKKDTEESSKLLLEIERKIDIIYEKISKANEISEIKLNQVDNRVTKLENGVSWLWRLCASVIITGIITAVVTFK